MNEGLIDKEQQCRIHGPDQYKTLIIRMKILDIALRHFAKFSMVMNKSIRLWVVNIAWIITCPLGSPSFSGYTTFQVEEFDG